MSPGASLMACLSNSVCAGMLDSFLVSDWDCVGRVDVQAMQANPTTRKRSHFRDAGVVAKIFME